MTLGELIKQLEAYPQDLVVKHGFGSPHSDRGNYSDIAFTPEENVSIASMLAHARSAVGKYFSGWKGGEYLMDVSTDAYIGKWGEAGEEITMAFFVRIDMDRRTTAPTTGDQSWAVTTIYHELKILPEYFDAVMSGVKTFEVRKNDRSYGVGHKVAFRSTYNDQLSGIYTITYVLLGGQYGIDPEYCVFGFVQDPFTPLPVLEK